MTWSGPSRHPAILRRDDALLVCIDYQESLLRVMHEASRVKTNGILLLGVAKILGIPIVATTQNANRLGGVIADVSDLLTNPTVDKMTFSAAQSPDVMSAIESSGRRQVVLCGIETHICIAQTAMDLVAAGYQVHVAADAVSSRSMEKHKLGMERIRDSGVLPIASEAVVYELLGQAGTPEFRLILPLVK